MPKIKQSIEAIEYNGQTGEIIKKTENKVLNWGVEPPYIKLYLQDILYLSDVPKSHENILFELLKRATYAGDDFGMCITLSSGLKKIIARTLNIKNVRSINNCLSELVKGKILFRIETGVYQFNPYLFGKGDWQDISKLRLKIDYDFNGKTFKTYCEYSKQNNKELLKDE